MVPRILSASKIKTCVICCGKFTKGTVGQTSEVCPACYPIWRRGYNILASIRNRCNKKKLPFDLDLEWMMSKLQGKCEVTGMSFKLDTIGKNYATRHSLAPSVDRIEPKLGYIKTNCRMIIWWINCAKQTFSDWDLWHLCNLTAASLGPKLAPTVEKKVGI